MIEYLKILFKKIYKKIIIRLFLLIYNKPKLLSKKSKDETVVEYSVNLDRNSYQIFEFKELPVPGNYFKDIKIYDAGDALRDKQGLTDDGFVIPYIDGTTSISRIGRVFPNNLIFKPLMIFCGLLMCIFWSYQKKLK